MLDIQAWIDANPQLPTISVLMPVRDPRPEHLRAAIASVREQDFLRWQLCIADDGSDAERFLSYVKELLEAGEFQV